MLMIANYIYRAFGRVSVRGVDRVRHVALTAAMGSKQCAAGHSTSAVMHGGENARDPGLDWRPGSGQVHLPSASARVVRSRASSL